MRLAVFTPTLCRKNSVSEKQEDNGNGCAADCIVGYFYVCMNLICLFFWSRVACDSAETSDFRLYTNVREQKHREVAHAPRPVLRPVATCLSVYNRRKDYSLNRLPLTRRMFGFGYSSNMEIGRSLSVSKSVFPLP